MGKKKPKHKIKVTSFSPDIADGAGSGKTLHVKIDGEVYTYETWFTRNSGGTELYTEGGEVGDDHGDCCMDQLDELSQVAEDAYWGTMMNLGYAGMVVQAEIDAVQACKRAGRKAPKTQVFCAQGPGSVVPT